MSAWTQSEEFELEVERYELAEHLEGASPTRRDVFSAEKVSTVSRRDLLKALGAGLLIVCLSSDIEDVEAQESGRGFRRGGQATPREIGAWIHVGEDGTVTAFTGKVEVGQNSRTSLSMVVAEELRLPLTAVRMLMGDTELVPYDMGTFGSQTTPRMVPILREAAAAAREAMIDMAAEEWKVDRSQIDVANSRVTKRGTSTSATFGELTKGRKLTKAIPSGIQTSRPQDWQIAGHPAHKVNAREIVTGTHKYPADIKRPGMLYAEVLRSESIKATLSSADTQAAEKLPGVRVIHTDKITGVVAPSQHLAAQAIDAINARWNSEPQVSSAQLYEHLKKIGENGGGRGDYSTGDIADGLSRSAVKLDAEYTVAYIAHAPLEPRAAVAEWNGDRLTVWTGTQRPFGVRQELASAFGMPEDRVRVIMPDTGSGYGGKHTGEAAIEAARLAKEAGKPVKLVWTREEEFRGAYFRPAGVITIRGGVAKDGELLAWEFHNYNSGGSGIRTPYEASNQRIAFHGAQSPLRQGSYRGLAATANNFARECHMEDLARESKLDSLAFRLKNLKEPRLRAVLETAAEKFGWGKSQPAPGRGFGLACGTEKGSFVATCAEIALEPVSGGSSPKFRVVRAVSAFECGAIINPEQLKNQVEGAIVQGLGGALFEAIHFDTDRLLNPRFSKYRVPRFGDTPKLETVLLDRKDLPSEGAGETPIICIAPAVRNAVLSASGVALRRMPLLGSDPPTG